MDMAVVSLAYGAGAFLLGVTLAVYVLIQFAGRNSTDRALNGCLVSIVCVPMLSTALYLIVYGIGAV